MSHLFLLFFCAPSGRPSVVPATVRYVLAKNVLRIRELSLGPRRAPSPIRPDDAREYCPRVSRTGSAEETLPGDEIFDLS